MKIAAIQDYQKSPIKVSPSVSARSITSRQIVPEQKMYVVSFKGNPSKNPWQMLNVGTEKKLLGGIYVKGGLGSVMDSIDPAVIADGAKYTVDGKTPDVRDALPYYTFNQNPDAPNEGKIYVLNKEGAEKRARGEELKLEDFKLVDQKYKLSEGERFSLITENKGNKLKYFLLNDTEISGEVERVRRDAFEMEKIPYRLFELELPPAERALHPEGVYIFHTPEMARGGETYGWCSLYDMETDPLSKTKKKRKGSTAYGGAQAGDIKNLKGRRSEDLFTTDFGRAIEDALPKMNTEAHGNFNPQNIGINDRFGISMLLDMTRKAQAGEEYWMGMRSSLFWHNIGRYFQGVYENPIDFFKIFATKEDLEKLKSNPNFAKVKEISDKIVAGKASQEESQQIYNFFKPYFEKFIDSEGRYNLTKAGLAIVDACPDNCKPGNVSRNFGKESRSMDTEDIARGLTQTLKEIESKTVDIVNGENVATMATEKQNGFFGKGELNKIFADVNDPRHYIPYSKTDAVDVIYDAKLTNKRNFIDIISDATAKLKEDADAIAKVMFDKDYVSDLRKAGDKELFTLGGFSKYAEGDILMLSWGRPDPQKGFAVTLNGFKKFLQDESIPLEARKHFKLILGGGSGNDIFRDDNPEWKLIQKAVKEIEEISVKGEKGVFKGNVCYINGMVPSRIANCADMGVFTSRFEPCGITPLECYAAGTPVASVKTGGAADFITHETGFLTKQPYMLSPSALGLDSKVSYEVLEAKRLEHTSKDVAEMLKEYYEAIKDGKFVEKQKEFIKNTLDQKIGWDENLGYNNGKSALNLHMNERWRFQDNNVSTEINKESFLGEFDNHAFDKKPPAATNNGAGTTAGTTAGTKSGWWSRLSGGKKTAIVAGCVVLGALATYGIYKANHNKNNSGSVEKTAYSAVIDDDDFEEDE